MRAVSLHQLILLIFTAVSLPSLLDALPQNLAPNTVELEVRRPPPKAAPGCPTARFLHAQTREFLGNFYDPSIPKQYAAFGGYDGFTKDKLWYNFTIKDITPNYPAAEKGKKIPPLGRWAKSRRQFADKLNVEMPKIFKVLGNIHYDENKVWYGGTLDDNDCLTGFWKGTYIATLKEAYGGKKKGATVNWEHYHTVKVRKPRDDGSNNAFIIQNATVNMDWSAFYKA